jgi:endonuclease-3 related protein
MTAAGSRAVVREVYRRLLRAFGHAGWWPAESAFEVCVGAILVQNTAWTNVERTLARLRRRKLLSFEALAAVPASRLAPLLRTSGTFRVKAARLRALLDHLGERYSGRVEAMARRPARALRAELMRVHGVGPETADSIALYAAGKAFFVVDAYTRRVFSRLGLLSGDEPYDVVQRFFEDRLPRRAELYGDYHAQIVRLAKDVCRTLPRCAECPLEDLCPKRGIPAAAARSRRHA